MIETLLAIFEEESPHGKISDSLIHTIKKYNADIGTTRVIIKYVLIDSYIQTSKDTIILSFRVLHISTSSTPLSTLCAVNSVSNPGFSAENNNPILICY